MVGSKIIYSNGLLEEAGSIAWNNGEFSNFAELKDQNLTNKILEIKKLFKRPKKSIKFNFENELINFYEEEIKSLISEYIIKSNNKNPLKEEEIFDFIF